ncbi:DUF1310 family protein [Streptococcus plurextorum]
MKTWQKWLLGIVIAFVGIIGIGVTYQMNRQAQLKEEMIKIVESEEAKTLFEEELKYLDPKALTEDGLIKTYEIDYDSFNKNPMGGFSVHLIINDSSDLYMRVSLGKGNIQGALEIESTYESREFRKFLQLGD